MKQYHRSGLLVMLTAGLLLSSAAGAEQLGTDSPEILAADAANVAATTTAASTRGSRSPSPDMARLEAAGSRAEIVVYKTESCGCCKAWVAYLEDEGFPVSAVNHSDLDHIKAENGLTAPELKSCHTALIDGYVIEGHVPASDIERLLAERPDVVGLSAPGMPMMSPGMGSLTPRDYDVLAFDKDGRSYVYSSY